MSSASPLPASSPTNTIKLEPSLEPLLFTRSILTEPLPSGPVLGLDVDPANQMQPDSDTSTTQTLSADLTALRAHYLKKSLVQLQISREIDALTTAHPSNASTLSFLGCPFSPPPRDANPFLDLPFLRYAFRQFALTFPFLAAAPRDFFSEKLQPFVSSVLSLNLDPNYLFDGESEDVEDDENSHPDSDLATRRKLLAKVERSLSTFLSSSLRLVEPEQVVRLSQADFDRLEALSKRSLARRRAKEKVSFNVSVVGVRTVVDKGRMRSRAHDEFIVRTRRSGFADVLVPRRYGDFRTLASELQKAHPDEYIPMPPSKDRRAVVGSPTNAIYDPEPGSPETLQSPSSSTAAYPNSPLSREKNRLTLRSYLFSLLSSPTLSSSPVLRSFLLSGPINLTPTEFEDVHRREEADKVREDGRKKFAKEIALRVDALREAVRNVKGDLVGKNGLSRIFGIIKVTPNVCELPPDYQAVLEWARISLASTIFQQFVASDNSSERFSSLKRLHGIMPYFMLKTMLKISNPIAMIRGVLDLFLAQPFGGRSLLQRMFSSSLAEEVKALESQIEAVKDKVDDPLLCSKIRQFVYAPKEIQDAYKTYAATEHTNLLIIVLCMPDEPLLSRAQTQRLARAHKAHKEYLNYRAQLADSDEDDGPWNEDAWLLEDLKVLTHLYSRLKDRERMINLIFEGSTADLLKDIITIFYSPLAQVYRAASIADSLGDLQNFINDLIKTVENVEELTQEDPHDTVQTFIDLVQRHEQAFYHFVYKVHSKGESLFDGLMRWIELFLTVMRDGLGCSSNSDSGSGAQLLSLEFILPHMGKERDEILAEVDAVALYHYKRKVAYEAKIRRRFWRAQTQAAGTGAGQVGRNEAEAEDEVATRALVEGLVSEIGLGVGVYGDVDELAAEETDDEGSDNSQDEEDDWPDESGSETFSFDEDENMMKPRHCSISEGSASSVSTSANGHIYRSDLIHSHHMSCSDQNEVKQFRRHRSSPSDQGTLTHRDSHAAANVVIPTSISTTSSRILEGNTTGLNSPQASAVSKTNWKSSASTFSSESSRTTSFPEVLKVPIIPNPKPELGADLAVRRTMGPSFVSGTVVSNPRVSPLSSATIKQSHGQNHVTEELSSRPLIVVRRKHRTRNAVVSTSNASTPPELEHIPKLLPVFVEMMRPLLQLRKHD